MTDPADLAVINEVLGEAGTELFSAYSLPAKNLGFPPEVHVTIDVASILGFTGPSLRGTLMFAATPGALTRTLPAPGADPRAWLAELSNQVLGRVKNKLAAYDVDLSISTPLVIRGERLSPSMRGDNVPLTFGLGEDFAYLWFDCELAAQTHLVKAAVPTEIAREGESLMF